MTTTPGRPLSWHPDGMWARRRDPIAPHPCVTAMRPTIVTGKPNVARSRAYDHDFSRRWRRTEADEYLSRIRASCRQCHSENSDGKESLHDCCPPFRHNGLISVGALQLPLPGMHSCGRKPPDGDGARPSYGRSWPPLPAHRQQGFSIGASRCLRCPACRRTRRVDAPTRSSSRLYQRWGQSAGRPTSVP